MRLTIKPIEIIEDPANEVTSSEIFTKRKIEDKDGNFLFNKDGIFSDRIFGKFNRCTCGALTKPGYCEECGCRVLNKRKIPNFYMKLDFDIPKLFIDYRDFDKETKTIVDNLMHYRGFLYNGKYVDFDLKLDMSKYKDEKIVYGKDAVLSLGISEEWYNKNVQRLISIPHTLHRKLLIQSDKIIIGKINTSYIDMLKTNESFRYNNNLNRVKMVIKLKFKTCKAFEELYTNLFNVLVNNNRNIVDNELKGQPETGMIRAVMTNNFGVDEDTVILGKYFIQTLYPKIYEDHCVNGEPDIPAINKLLKKENYLVLFNRQPTIGAKSIIAMRPVFSELEQEQFVIQANPIVYDGLAADVDGDALNVIALYTIEACEEAQKLLPSVNYIEGSNSSIRNGIIEEFKYIELKIGV